MDLSVEQMAEAHLQSVEKAIIDLENQVQNMYQEIKKLKEYLEKGKEVVRNSTSKSAF